jgi:hypothetical protein
LIQAIEIVEILNGEPFDPFVKLREGRLRKISAVSGKRKNIHLID